MKIAFLSFINLEQAGSKKQSIIRELSLRVNVMANHSGVISKRGDGLAKGLKSDVAEELEVKKPNTQEL